MAHRIFCDGCQREIESSGQIFSGERHFNGMPVKIKIAAMRPGPQSRILNKKGWQHDEQNYRTNSSDQLDKRRRRHDRRDIDRGIHGIAVSDGWLLKAV